MASQNLKLWTIAIIAGSAGTRHLPLALRENSLKTHAAFMYGYDSAYIGKLAHLSERNNVLM